MVRCIDCGFCGYYIDMLDGLRWRELDMPNRRAFEQGVDRQPSGQNPGTGHWQHLQCNRYLQEWKEGDKGSFSHEDLMEALLRERERCEGFVEYHSGLTPPEHNQFRTNPQSLAMLEEYDVFLSHSGEDNELAERIAQLLTESNITVFTTPFSIPSGKWEPQIEQALQRSHHMWLLLTESALDRSIWVHQEFGYFYGYHYSIGDTNVDKRLHYFEIDGNTRRPGLYGHFQGTPTPTFDDPVLLAREIAKSLGKSFKEPERPEDFKRQVIRGKALGHPEFRITQLASEGNESELWQRVEFSVLSSETIFNLSAVSLHPNVIVSTCKPLPQIPGGEQRQLSLTFDWTDNRYNKEIADLLLRNFEPPLGSPRPSHPEPSGPLVVTFETQSGQVLGAVTYIVVHKSRRFPQVSLVSEGAPFEWIVGKNA